MLRWAMDNLVDLDPDALQDDLANGSATRSADQADSLACHDAQVEVVESRSTSQAMSNTMRLLGDSSNTRNEPASKR